ncbi:DUF5057 domain-containing protein [Paenibacillus apii]|uniref:DUF5057 domain-containing protein n=1 Tax=Paenibacillus apii TaxID=1850370 RepID=UPI00143AEBC7|nr:DUF5057 domain-containing protein [Paenibacillus apii]NJJ39471.1 DUF5057 domain-containing protein [Paenibacillus apii]
MKLTKSRIFLLLSCLALLGLLAMPIMSLVQKVNADPFVYTIRMLEVTSSGESDLDSLTADNVHVDTISMNRFVSLRDDFDGKYDAVYIGEGASAQNGGSGKSDDLIDITALKAKEITEYYINKGLLVILDTGYLESPTSILYTSFNKYRTDPARPNVRFVGGSELSALIKEINIGTTDLLPLLKQRPRLTITNKSDITDYSRNQSYLYQPGDTLDFRFNAANVEDLKTHPIGVKLYISPDKSVPVKESQVVAVSTLDQSPNGEIAYKLPDAASGLLYWKLEITDHLSANKLKDYDSGVIRFRGKQKVVNILQVVPSVGNSERSSSLKDPNNMNQSYLDTKDYKYNITVKTDSEFNNEIAARYERDGTYGLNGVYDMLILGFRNTGNTALTDQAAQAVLQYARDTKQSVILASDAVYHGNSPAARAWEQYFLDLAGQIDPQKNSDMNAPYAAKSVKPVNDGLLAHYPFYLSTLNDHNQQTDIITPDISTAHNSSYPINLEDPSIIPWYNVIGAGRDSEDSANHYYTYSRGNITYSATGHILGTPSNSHFPDWEQQLFVNMMYKAYAGSNHRPEITVHLPQQNDTVPTYQNTITVDYKVEDPDPEDQELYTTVRFKSNGEYLTEPGMPETQILSGKTVHETFANPLPDGGPLTIEIAARDKQGALAVANVNITVLKASANLELTRTLSSNVSAGGEVAKDEAFTITYSVKPKSIPFDQAGTSNQSSEALTISDIRFLETLPANLERNGDWPEGISVSGNASSGYTLSKSLGSITYTLKTVDGVKTYVPDSPDPIVFSIDVRAAVAKTYHFDTSEVSFVDIHPVSAASPSPLSSRTTLSFPKMTVIAVERNTRTLSLTADKDKAVVNESVALTAAYSHSNDTGVRYTWSAVDNTGKSVPITGSQGSASFSADKTGKYTVTVSVTSDQSIEDITATKEITVGLNSLTIGYLSTVYVDNTITLTAIPDPDADKEQYEWHLVNEADINYGGFTDNQGGTKADATGKKVEFKGIQPSAGVQIVVTAAGITSPPFTIKVLSEPNLEFSPDYGEISIDQSFNLYSFLHTINPYGDIPSSLAEKLVWRIEGNHEAPAVTLQVKDKTTVMINGIREGTERIKVSYSKGTGETVTAYYTIKVIDPATADHRY